MKEKLIIENRTDLPMEVVLEYVGKVLRKGRISNDGKQYCYGVTFSDGIDVFSDLNKKSDRLIITRRKP